MPRMLLTCSVWHRTASLFSTLHSSIRARRPARVWCISGHRISRSLCAYQREYCSSRKPDAWDETLLQETMDRLPFMDGVGIKHAGGKRIFNQELRNTVPKEMREAVMTKKRYEEILQGLESGQRNFCPNCWLPSMHCMCSNAALPKDIAAAFPHRILIYMHVKEMGRPSNTGGLVRLALGPEKAGLFIANIRECEDLIQAEISNNARRTMILFPSQNSIPVVEFVARSHESHDQGVKKQGNDAVKLDDGAMQFDTKGFTIIMVDGTWNQARRLQKRFPDEIARVHLDEKMLLSSKDGDLSSPMRAQVEPDRICSLTALTYLLRQLHTDEVICSHLLQLLRTKSQRVLDTAGREWKKQKLVSSHTR